MSANSETARAKVNLALHVTGRRSDGYHLLDSLVAFADFGDVVSVARATASRLTISGPFAKGLSASPDNLVLSAAEWFAPDVALDIHLEKTLPVASGLGGGSADAAATIRALARLLDRTLPDAAATLPLGADVPVCLTGLPCRMAGIGEELAPILSFPACPIVLANPGVPLETARVFGARSGDFGGPLPSLPPFPDLHHLCDYLAQCRNDLEPAACHLVPAIAQLLAALRAQNGCRLARMSGSGASCFALFDRPDLAEAAAASIGRLSGHWAVASTLTSR